jgi:dephospho-CoA kinase
MYHAANEGSYDQKDACKLDLLRQVYGRLFIVISIYSERQSRLERLIDRIASGHSEARLAESHTEIAAELIRRAPVTEEYFAKVVPVPTWNVHHLGSSA